MSFNTINNLLLILNKQITADCFVFTYNLLVYLSHCILFYYYLKFIVFFFFFLCLPTYGSGQIDFGADPVGVSVTLFFLHNIL